MTTLADNTQSTIDTSLVKHCAGPERHHNHYDHDLKGLIREGGIFSPSADRVL